MTVNFHIRYNTRQAFFENEAEYVLMFNLHYISSQTLRLYMYYKVLLENDDPKSTWGIDTSVAYYDAMVRNWCQLFERNEPSSYHKLVMLKEKIVYLYGEKFSSDGNIYLILNTILDQRHQISREDFKKFKDNITFIRDKDLIHKECDLEVLKKLKEYHNPITRTLAQATFGLLTILVDILSTYPGSQNGKNFCMNYNPIQTLTFDDYVSIDLEMKDILDIMKKIDCKLLDNQIKTFNLSSGF